MTNETSERSIFLAAIDIADAEKRNAYLDEACQDHPELRAKVDELLEAHNQSGDILDLPTEDHSSSNDTDLPSRRIDQYKLLEEIGEGGMGVVYMAEQTEPVRRRVALKIIKPGMDSRQVIARFEAERQALAMMDHPNIARVFDAGTTEQGHPYFVMELVRGVPITQYCDEHHLTPKERLELFVPVCQAIQHAHQKGVIHRDLKPSNVLVTEYEGRPMPKIIDFGVAKATHTDLTDKTMFTRFGQVVGTLEYMSPEQATHAGSDVDTRSDVYALGVLLYELLTGTTPFDRQRLKSAALDEVLRIIRDEDPPLPSTRLSTVSTLPSIAASRRTQPDRLGALVRGELDWIVMRAMEKDRTKRYETASNFARDIERYLEGDAVQASPPSTTYRFRKFVRKHRGAVITGSTISVSLVAALAVSLISLSIAWQKADELAITVAQLEVAKRQAEEGLAAKEAQEREKLRLAAQSVESAALVHQNDDDLTIYEQEMLQAISLYEGADSHYSAAECWSRLATKRFDNFDYPGAITAYKHALSGESQQESHNRFMLAYVYWDLGEVDAAISQLEKQVSSNRETNHAWTDNHILNLASFLTLLGRYDDAIAQFDATSKTHELLQATNQDGAPKVTHWGTQLDTIIASSYYLAHAMVDLPNDEHVSQLARVSKRSLSTVQRAVAERLQGNNAEAINLITSEFKASIDGSGLTAKSFARGQCGWRRQSLETLAEWCLEDGCPEAAIQAIDDERERTGNFLEENHVYRLALLRMRGELLMKIGRIDEAERDLLQANQPLEQSNLPVDTTRRSIAESLTRLYTIQGRVVEARRWRDVAQELATTR